MNDVRQAARSAASYMLFDPEDNVMQQNLVYVKWSKTEALFSPHFKDKASGRS